MINDRVSTSTIVHGVTGVPFDWIQLELLCVPGSCGQEEHSGGFPGLASWVTRAMQYQKKGEAEVWDRTNVTRETCHRGRKTYIFRKRRLHVVCCYFLWIEGYCWSIRSCWFIDRFGFNVCESDRLDSMFVWSDGFRFEFGIRCRRSGWKSYWVWWDFPVLMKTVNLRRIWTEFCRNSIPRKTVLNRSWHPKEF